MHNWSILICWIWNLFNKVHNLDHSVCLKFIQFQTFHVMDYFMCVRPTQRWLSCFLSLYIGHICNPKYWRLIYNCRNIIVGNIGHVSPLILNIFDNCFVLLMLIYLGISWWCNKWAAQKRDIMFSKLVVTVVGFLRHVSQFLSTFLTTVLSMIK